VAGSACWGLTAPRREKIKHRALDIDLGSAPVRAPTFVVRSLEANSGWRYPKPAKTTSCGPSALRVLSSNRSCIRGPYMGRDLNSSDSATAARHDPARCNRTCARVGRWAKSARLRMRYLPGKFEHSRNARASAQGSISHSPIQRELPSPPAPRLAGPGSLASAYLFRVRAALKSTTAIHAGCRVRPICPQPTSSLGREPRIEW